MNAALFDYPGLEMVFSCFSEDNKNVHESLLDESESEDYGKTLIAIRKKYSKIFAMVLHIAQSKSSNAPTICPIASIILTEDIFYSPYQFLCS